MPTDFTFRLSLYLTLGLSCVCMGYAEHDLLPEVPYIAGAVIVALVVLFCLETRVQLLTIPDANRVGLIIGLIGFGWLGLRLARGFNKPDVETNQWQLLGIAVFGPLLMSLMPAKLARREKHVGDYWGLHGAGLTAAALSGALAEKSGSFILIGLYAAAAVWNLSLFYIRRAAGEVPPLPGHTVPALAGVVVSRRVRHGLLAALALAAVSAAVAVPLYLLTPESPGGKLDLRKSRVEIGYAADQMIDLNQTGELEENEQVAFEVTATANGAPKTDLPTDLRWRGRMLRRYTSGSWQPGDMPLPGVDRVPSTPAEWSPPNLGQGQCTLTFTIPGSLRGQFLADPIYWNDKEPAPAATITPGGFRSWFWGGNGLFYWNSRRGNNEELRYVQVWRPGPLPDAGPAFHIRETDFNSTKLQLQQNPVPRVKDYADGVLRKLIQSGQLRTDWVDPDTKQTRTDWVNPFTNKPRAELQDRIARAFAHYLATTTEFTYTTDIRRERKDIDPIEEFIFHTKAGHCERYATALTLMLRAEGIPSVLILGFKGCEDTLEPGKYIVRQGHAHAWASALVPVPDQPPPATEDDRLYHWLSLDPTGSGGTQTQAGSNAGGLGTELRSLINTYILTSSAEQRQRAAIALFAWLTRWDVLGVGVLVVVGVILIRWQIRRSRQPMQSVQATPQETRWFARLLAVLASSGFAPRQGQTPREFAAAVAITLRGHAATAAVAEVPVDWAEAYYETRFGSILLTPDRLASLDTRLEELKQALVAQGSRGFQFP
jgi:transglutaminase-like putative cysteine protease